MVNTNCNGNWQFISFNGDGSLASRCWAGIVRGLHSASAPGCGIAQLSADGWWNDGPVTAVSILTRNYDHKLSTSTFYRESFFRPLYLDSLLVVRGYNVIMYSVTLALIVALRASNVATLSPQISINPADGTHHQSSGLRILSRWYWGTQKVPPVSRRTALIAKIWRHFQHPLLTIQLLCRYCRYCSYLRFVSPSFVIGDGIFRLIHPVCKRWIIGWCMDATIFLHFISPRLGILMEIGLEIEKISVEPFD